MVLVVSVVLVISSVKNERPPLPKQSPYSTPIVFTTSLGHFSSERPQCIPWAQVPSNRPWATYKKDKKSEFPSLGGSWVSREVGQNSSTVKTEKFRTLGVYFRENKSSRTKVWQTNSNVRNWHVGRTWMTGSVGATQYISRTVFQSWLFFLGDAPEQSKSWYM